MYTINIQTLEKDKTKTYKSDSKTATFQRKIAASGGTWTHDLQRSRLKLYQLTYRGGSAGWVQISYASQHTKQSKASVSTWCQVQRNLTWRCYLHVNTCTSQLLQSTVPVTKCWHDSPDTFYNHTSYTTKITLSVFVIITPLLLK